MELNSRKHQLEEEKLGFEKNTRANASAILVCRMDVCTVELFCNSWMLNCDCVPHAVRPHTAKNI